MKVMCGMFVCLTAAACIDAGAGTGESQSAKPGDETVHPIIDDQPGDTTGPGGPDIGGEGTDSLLPAGALAEGLVISDIAIFQGSKVTVVKSGERAAPKTFPNLSGGPALGAVPVVAYREALVRIYVSDLSIATTPVIAELRLESKGTVRIFRDNARLLAGSSSDSSLGSTFNIRVPYGVIAPATQFSVQLVDPARPYEEVTTTHLARWPADGSSDALGAQTNGQGHVIEIVPIVYGGHKPDTSAEQIKIYDDFIYQTYPVPKLDTIVHSEVDAPDGVTIDKDGNGWDQILTFVERLRQQEGAPNNTYYYGLFSPAATFGEYCDGGCVLGLGPLGTNAASSPRSGVGLGYGAGLGSKVSMFATTLAQELGHSVGILHAPSGGAPDVDPSFPYSDGSIGEWGFGLRDGKLYDARNLDFMGYGSTASPWVSDYVQGLMFTRFKFDNRVLFAGGEALRFEDGPRTYQTLYVRADGTLKWGETVDYAIAPHGDSRVVTLRDESGAAVGSVTGEYFAYDHANLGGYLVFPTAETKAYRSLSFDGPKGASGIAAPGL